MVTRGDPVEAFARLQARHARCGWLDGGGARDWSRRRSILGWLDDDDVSLSYDAAAREVTRHAGGRSTVASSRTSPSVRRSTASSSGRPTASCAGSHCS